ncbi:MAG: hypothetical protein KY439_09580, partial [Actinobacteria bacterium]|nr:hypothetical protein [Actinomycetota bacterium]
AEAEFAHVLTGGRAVTAEHARTVDHYGGDDGYLGLPGLMSPEQTAALLARGDEEHRRRATTGAEVDEEAQDRTLDVTGWQAAGALRREVNSLVGQLAAPQAINELVTVGLIRQQTGWMIDYLSDPGRTGLCIVATPEEMPVNETIELARRVEHETNVNLAAVVVNRVLPELFGRGEEEVFERLEQPEGRACLVEAVGAGVGPVLDAARLAVTLRRTRAEHLHHLRTQLPSSLPLLFVPELFAKAHGLRSTRMVAEALSAELGY